MLTHFQPPFDLVAFAVLGPGPATEPLLLPVAEDGALRLPPDFMLPAEPAFMPVAVVSFPEAALAPVAFMLPAEAGVLPLVVAVCAKADADAVSIKAAAVRIRWDRI